MGGGLGVCRGDGKDRGMWERRGVVWEAGVGVGGGGVSMWGSGTDAWGGAGG